MKLMGQLRSLFGGQRRDDEEDVSSVAAPIELRPPLPAEVVAPLDDRANFLRRVGSLENFIWLLNRIPFCSTPELHLSARPESCDDLELVQRVMKAYRVAIQSFKPSEGFWDVWHFALKKPIHEALAGDDIEAAAAVLRDPAANVFFWGFDAIASSPEGEIEPHELVLTRLNRQADWRDLYALWLCDTLVSFAEVVGARRAAYPEMEVDKTLANRGDQFDVNSVLDEIEHELGVELVFPNPFANERGLKSKRGIIGFRSIQSMYQAWRISQLANGNPHFKVLEIGAGLGRTAYFAHLFGVTNYTIVDVPLTNAAQGYFLGRVLGPQCVYVGEEAGAQGIRIIPNTAVASLDETFDLIVNVDSFTEMPEDVAQDYWTFAKKATRKVLSINHEFNPHTVRELYGSDRDCKAVRYPYPMRRGYVEELISW